MSLAAGVDIGQGVTQLWTTVTTFLPKIFLFAVVVLLTWLLAKVIARLVLAILHKVGFDRAVERGALASALQRSRHHASDIVARLVYYVIWLIGLGEAFNAFGPNNAVTLYFKGVVAYLPLILAALIELVLGVLIAGVVKTAVGGALGGLSYGQAVANVAAGAILFLTGVAILTQLHIAGAVVYAVEIAVLATLAGILIVGVGGGLVQPMQERWERGLARLEDEAPRAREQFESNRPAPAAEPVTVGASPLRGQSPAPPSGAGDVEPPRPAPPTSAAPPPPPPTSAQPPPPPTSAPPPRPAPPAPAAPMPAPPAAPTPPQARPSPPAFEPRDTTPPTEFYDREQPPEPYDPEDPDWRR